MFLFSGYKHVATTITVVMGMSVRIVAIPFAVLGMLGARKAEDKGPRMFFFCLLGLGFVCFLDLFLCLFEVHAVCGSATTQPPARGSRSCATIKAAATC